MTAGYAGWSRGQQADHMDKYMDDRVRSEYRRKTVMCMFFPIGRLVGTLGNGRGCTEYGIIFVFAPARLIVHFGNIVLLIRLQCSCIFMYC